MTTYVAFLRGVNLGSHRTVAMPRLVALAVGLGYDDVWTWLRTGNLVLTTTKRPAQIERELERALEDEYASTVDVTVRSADELAALLGRNPFPDGSPSQVTLTFLGADPPAEAETRLAEVATDAEPFVLDGREVWVRFGDGQARSRLAATFADVVGVGATTRTLGSVARIVGKVRARAQPSNR